MRDRVLAELFQARQLSDLRRAACNPALIDPQALIRGWPSSATRDYRRDRCSRVFIPKRGVRLELRACSLSRFVRLAVHTALVDAALVVKRRPSFSTFIIVDVILGRHEIESGRPEGREPCALEKGQLLADPARQPIWKESSAMRRSAPCNAE